MDKDAKEESSVFYIPGVELAFPKKGRLSNALFSWMKTEYLSIREMEEKESQDKTGEEKKEIQIKYDDQFYKIFDRASDIFGLVSKHLSDQLDDIRHKTNNGDVCDIREVEDNIFLEVTLKTGETFDIDSFDKNVRQGSDFEIMMECQSSNPVCTNWVLANKELIEMAEKWNQWIYDFVHCCPSERGNENW